MEKRLLFLLVNLFLLCGGALAQTKVTGTVVSQEDGEPVIGASVVVAGAARTGTVTDIDGHFSLEVPAGKKLVVSYIGMQSQTLTPAAKMTIRLKADSKSLGEVSSRWEIVKATREIAADLAAGKIQDADINESSSPNT